MKRRDLKLNWNGENEDHTFAVTQYNAMSDTMWKYEQLRAGEVYTRFMFNTRQEAEEFATQMAKAAPDLFCRIEPVEASAVWN